MTAQQTLWKRANVPNFPGLDKAHCICAVAHLAVSSSISASSTLGISCPYSQFRNSGLLEKWAFGTLPWNLGQVIAEGQLICQYCCCFKQIKCARALYAFKGVLN